MYPALTSWSWSGQSELWGEMVAFEVNSFKTLKCNCIKVFPHGYTREEDNLEYICTLNCVQL